MKKLLLLIITYLILISCTNEMDSISENVNQKKIDQIFLMSNDEQIIAYKLLNKYEKKTLWVSKLKNLKIQRNINEIQKKYIDELISTLNVKYFVNDNLTDRHYLSYLSKMKEIGYTIFTAEEMVNNFSNISGKSKNYQNRPPMLIYCTCSTVDDWCITGDCYSFGRCDDANAGCGWWLGEDCNGICATLN
jgi:hypothetical protein